MRTPSLLIVATAFGMVACADHNSGGPTVPESSPLTVQFETRTEIGLGRTLRDLPVEATDAVFADFTRDGIIDMAVASLDGRVYVQVGQGSGVFAPGASYQVGGAPLAIRSEDIDGQNGPDLVVVSAETDQAHSLLNRGNGDLDVVQSFDVLGFPTSIAVGDCNGDGVHDLVVTHLSRANLMLFLGNGNGRFGPGTPLQAPIDTVTSSVQIADINVDGRPDVLVVDSGQGPLGQHTSSEGKVVMLLGGPGGVHQTVVEVRLGTGKCPLGLAVGDMTGNNVPDVIVTNFEGGSAEVISDVGGGRYEVVRTLPIRGKPSNCLIADINQDAFPDFVTCVLDRSSVSVFFGSGSGVTDEEIRLNATGFPFRPVVADINDDGRLDLAAVSGGIDILNVYFGSGGSFAAGRLHDVGLDGPAFVAAANFDGSPDGSLELAVSGSTDLMMATRIRVVSGGDPGLDGEPTVDEEFRTEMSLDVTNMKAADIDRDGRTDLVATFAPGVKILRNTTQNGRVSFQEIPSANAGYLAPGRGPFELVARDLDGDQITDLAIAYHDDQEVKVLYGTGNPFEFGPPLSTPLAGDPIGITAGNFDQDGALELAVSCDSLSIVTILDRQADGSYAVVDDIPVAMVPNLIRSADFNEDGRDDLAVSVAFANLVTFVFPTDQGFDTLDIQGIGENPTALIATDINRDGHSDVLVTSMTSSDFRILFGDGGGGFPTVHRFPGSYSATSAALVDLNGDRLPELTIGTVHHKRLSIFKNLSLPLQEQ